MTQSRRSGITALAAKESLKKDSTSRPRSGPLHRSGAGLRRHVPVYDLNTAAGRPRRTPRTQPIQREVITLADEYSNKFFRQHKETLHYDASKKFRGFAAARWRKSILGGRRVTAWSDLDSKRFEDGIAWIGDPLRGHRAVVRLRGRVRPHQRQPSLPQLPDGKFSRHGMTASTGFPRRARKKFR